MTTMHVASTTLNLRSEPGVKPGTVIATLGWSQPVDVLADAVVPGWKQVKAGVNGAAAVGFASGKLLRAPLSPKKEALIAEAVAQWIRFDRGKGKESVAPYAGFVGEMWQALGTDLDGNDVGVPWSAAFISFVVRRAGYAGFRFAAAHARYVNDSIVKRETGQASPFWGFRLQEHKPQLGDMVCRWRGKKITYEDAARRDGFTSHCDIVVGVGDDHMATIGGNVANSVSVTRYRLDANGNLDSSNNVFAVLRNNL
jgi:hypothetical protein